MEMDKMKGMVCGYDKKTLTIVVTLVIVAGAAFYVGAKYEKSKLIRLGLTKNANDICFNPSIQAAESVTGEIISINENAVTIKKGDGSILEAAIVSSTKIGKKGNTLSNFSVGQSVVIRGLKNSEGRFLTQSIQAAASNGSILK